MGSTSSWMKARTFSKSGLAPSDIRRSNISSVVSRPGMALSSWVGVQGAKLERASIPQRPSRSVTIHRDG
jgi:hypothetical protein